MQGLVAIQAVLTDEGSGGKPWAAGAVAQSPGKRKRSRRRWCLQEMAQVALEDEVSCIHLLPYPQGGCQLPLCLFLSVHPSVCVSCLPVNLFVMSQSVRLFTCSVCRLAG